MAQQLPAARTRIAPTPSGYLHVGNAFSFVVTALVAMRQGADIVLRIDDLDRERFRLPYLEDVFNVLDFLGIEPTIGPSGPEAFLKTYSQHLRIDRYMVLLNTLRDAGLLYVCHCSRKMFTEVAPHAFCACKSQQLAFEQPNAVWRWAGDLPQLSCTDFDGTSTLVDLSITPGRTALFQRNQLPAYQIASLSDDLDFGITHIVRGADLTDSTAFQLHLAQQLDRPTFAQIKFLHHGLVQLESMKLSKSEGATAVHWARSQGFTRASFFTSLAQSWGLKAKKVDQLRELNDLLGDAFPACTRGDFNTQTIIASR